jgi:hypothetical protein
MTCAIYLVYFIHVSARNWKSSERFDGRLSGAIQRISDRAAEPAAEVAQVGIKSVTSPLTAASNYYETTGKLRFSKFTLCGGHQRPHGCGLWGGERCSSLAYLNFIRYAARYAGLRNVVPVRGKMSPRLTMSRWQREWQWNRTRWVRLQCRQIRSEVVPLPHNGGARLSVGRGKKRKHYSESETLVGVTASVSFPASVLAAVITKSTKRRSKTSHRGLLAGMQQSHVGIAGTARREQSQQGAMQPSNSSYQQESGDSHG